jgi:hypothetical protein
MNSSESVSARFLSLLFAASLSVLAMPMVAGVKAHGEEFRLLATTVNTNLRKASRTDSEVLVVVPNGMTVRVGTCRDGWCRVSWKGKDGYAIRRNLGIPTTPSWPNVPVTAGPGDHSSLQKTAKAAREQEEHEHEESSPEHSFVLEIGTAGEWPLNDEHPNFGGAIAAEVEPIENWLELEFSLSTLATAGHTELSGDLLFKKPFRLSPTVEFMVGAGPSFSRTLDGPDRGDAWSPEFALDWMFWPTKNIGWFIEPTWSVNPRNGQQSTAVSIGVLIGFSK